jgi:hypothetical protein
MPSMKAVRLYEFGGPDKLVYEDQPVPEIGAADVLVKVLATSVSRWDVKYRAGEGHADWHVLSGSVTPPPPHPHIQRAGAAVTDMGVLEAQHIGPKLRQPQPVRHLPLEHTALAEIVGACPLAGDH